MASSRAHRGEGQACRATLAEQLLFLPARLLRGTVGQLEPDRAVRIGAALGRVVAALGGSRSSIARSNLRIAFPSWSEAARRRLLARSYANLGRGAAELALLQGRHREKLLAGVTVEGLEHLEAATRRSENGGVLVLSAHFGTWDLCAAAMTQRGVPVTVIHRGVGNPLIKDFMTRARGDMTQELRMGRSVVGVIRALGRGRKIAMLLDQNAHRDEGTFVPFFSELACTRSGPALIAMRWGVPVLPVFIFRQTEAARHVIRILPALVIEAGEDDAEAALKRNLTRMNRVIERVIEESPEQWLWWHRRWKTRPARCEETAGEAPARDSLYPPRRAIGRRIRRALSLS